MKVLYVCTELAPLMKTGGLADVGSALPPALTAAGCETRLLLPAFPSIVAGVDLDEGAALTPEGPCSPPVLQHMTVPARIRLGRVTSTGQPVYLLQASELYLRDGGPYQDATGHDWPDNAARFALLGWAAAWLGLGGDPHWQPDVMHAHDWHAALAPLYLRQMAGNAARPVSVFTVHNLAYQGLFPAQALPETGLPWSVFTMEGLEFYGQMSFMKAGLQFADAITTVSPRYAREIMTAAQGCGLDGVLRERADHVSGILNGVDYALWDPATDPMISARYDSSHLAGKALARSALQRELGLEERPDARVFGVVSRLTAQKGLQLLPPVVDGLVERGGQLVILGNGEPIIESALRKALTTHPTQAAFRTGYDEALAHRIIAGADVLLVPSQFEPCGLTQLYAMRYGTLPLVHGVGGLADTVTDADADGLAGGRATGFVFHRFDVEALRAALQRVFDLTCQPPVWAAVQRQAMQRRFDWREAALAYRTLFEELIHRRDAA